MKGIHLIAIAFLASWTVISAKLPTIFEAENECPVVDPCPPKLIRHETDCTKYYECKNRQKQLRFCSAGLYFSKSWRGCVNQQISDCPVTPTPTTPTPTPPGDCINGDLLKHECECTKFYECIYGRKALRDCPPGQRFEPQWKSCIPGDTNCENTPPPPICYPEGKLIPHECQCQKYYECKGGQKALRECAEGTHFDNTSLTCILGSCPPPPGICVTGDAKEHQCDCDKYYRCNNNEWLLEYCQNGEHFSKTLKRCTDPIGADCDPNIKPGDCSLSNPSRWPIPHECDCRLYYQCENGKKKIYDCIWGYYFDFVNLRCDVAANVKNICKNNWDNNWLK